MSIRLKSDRPLSDFYLLEKSDRWLSDFSLPDTTLRSLLPDIFHTLPVPDTTLSARHLPDITVPDPTLYRPTPSRECSNT